MKKNRKLIILTGLILLAAIIVWAAVELSGQVNSMAQDTGSRSAEMESLTIETIRKPIKTATSPKPPNCNWGKERSIRKALESNDKSYEKLRDAARKEMEKSGKISQSLRKKILDQAGKYKKLCDQYAAMWQACKCVTRAKTAKATGESRVKSAIVFVSAYDGDAMAAMRDAQKKMRDARREYAFGAADAGEISTKDQADIRSKLIPRVKSFIDGLTTFLNKVSSFIMNLQSGFFGGGTDHGGGGGADRLDAETQKSVDQAKSVKSTGSSMLLEARDLLADVEYLAGGPRPSEYELMVDRFKPCFIGSSEE